MPACPFFCAHMMERISDVCPSKPASDCVGGLSERVQAKATLFMNNVLLGDAVVLTQTCLYAASGVLLGINY